MYGRIATTVRKTPRTRKIQGRREVREFMRQKGLWQDQWPRHESAYQIIQSALPDFSWTPKDVPGHQRVVDFQGYPTINRFHPNLAELVLYALREPGEPGELVFDAFPPKVQRHVEQLLQIGRVGKVFAQMLLNLPVVLPPNIVMHAVADWLRRAAAGEESTVFVGVCPDYAVDKNGRYTFESLGDGVGVVAQRALHSLPMIWKATQSLGLNIKFVVAIGDFEADSEETRNRVGLSKPEFVQRLWSSQDAFRAACPEDMPVHTTFATQVGDWYGRYELAEAEVAAGRYCGVFPLTEQEFDDICESRRSLYERWYGKGIDVQAVLKRQIPEYIAMASLAEEGYPNCLILGADATVMSIFDHGLSDHLRPVIYLRTRPY